MRQGTLREFQQGLAQKLQQAQRTTAGAGACIAVVTGARRWLFELAQVSEVIVIPELFAVPFTQSWYLGLFNHRSRLTGAIDFEAFATGTATTRSESDRLLVLSPALPLRCALKVSQVAGIVAAERVRPDAGEGELPAWARGVRVGDEAGTWAAVDAQALACDPAFIAIARY